MFGNIIGRHYDKVFFLIICVRGDKFYHGGRVVMGLFLNKNIFFFFFTAKIVFLQLQRGLDFFFFCFVFLLDVGDGCLADRRI